MYTYADLNEHSPLDMMLRFRPPFSRTSSECFPQLSQENCGPHRFNTVRGADV